MCQLQGWLFFSKYGVSVTFLPGYKDSNDQGIRWKTLTMPGMMQEFIERFQPVEEKAEEGKRFFLSAPRNELESWFREREHQLI